MKQKVQEGIGYDKYVAITREEIESLLLGLNIPHRRVNTDEYGFSREIEFEVGDDTYSILWFKNQSTLRLGKSKGAPEIPFRHMFHDRTHPSFNSKGGAIGFCYDRYVRNSVFDREFPFESLRIPLQGIGPDNRYTLSIDGETAFIKDGFLDFGRELPDSVYKVVFPESARDKMISVSSGSNGLKVYFESEWLAKQDAGK